MVELVPQDDARPDWAERVVPLPAKPLPVPELGVACADIICARPSVDAIERLAFGDSTTPVADDDGEFCLSIDVADPRWQRDRIAFSAQCVRELGEQQWRTGRLKILLFGVVRVVKADTNNLRIRAPE